MKKEFIAVCTALFLLVFGMNLSGALLVPYTIELGGTGATVGIVFSCMYAVRLVFGTPIGRLSQKKGAKRILTYSLALSPVIAVAYWVSWNMPSLLFARLLHGVSSAMLLPMGMAYIGEVSPEGQEGRYMAVYNAIIFAAGAFGPLAGGLIYDQYGIRAAFMVLFGLAVTACLMMSTLAGGWKRSGEQVTDRNDPAHAAENKPVGFAQFWRNKQLLALCGLNISMAVMLALFGASFTQLALSRNMGMGEIGLLVAIMNIVIGITQIPLGRMVDRYNKISFILVSGLAVALLAACLPFAGGVRAIVLLIIPAGIFVSLNLSASAALSAIVGREMGMSNTMGILGTATSAGTIAGYLALGFVADLLGINTAFYLSAAVFILGLAGFLLLWRKTGKSANATKSIC